MGYYNVLGLVENDGIPRNTSTLENDPRISEDIAAYYNGERSKLENKGYVVGNIVGNIAGYKLASKGAFYKNNSTYTPVQNEDISWDRGLINVDELDSNQFSNLKNNGIVKVNPSGSDRPLTGAPNSFYSTGNGEHIFVYDNNGKLIYDLSNKRVKSFKINLDPTGKEHFQPYKLKGSVPDEIKKIYGW